MGKRTTDQPHDERNKFTKTHGATKFELEGEQALSVPDTTSLKELRALVETSEGREEFWLDLTAFTGKITKMIAVYIEQQVELGNAQILGGGAMRNLSTFINSTRKLLEKFPGEKENLLPKNITADQIRAIMGVIDEESNVPEE